MPENPATTTTSPLIIHPERLFSKVASNRAPISCAETMIVWEVWANAMAADALMPSVDTSSATIDYTG